MFGYLRFFLAFLVLISHMNIRIFDMNPGVVAVVIFYLLAGHVVSHLWDNVLPRGKGRLWRFYRDRVLRIMPMYLYLTGLTLVFLAVTGYGDPQYSAFKLLGNLLVVPVNYYMYLDTAILTDPSWALIPTAWSLGAELQAYALLPLLLVSRTWGGVMTAGTFGVYLLANFQIIHPDYFGYRLIFGVFFMFGIGAWIQRSRHIRLSWKDPNHVIPWVIWAGCVGLFLWLCVQDRFSPAYTRETVLGMMLGIPVVYLFGRSRVKLPFNALFGSLSYGVFLAHFLMIWFVDHWGLSSAGTGIQVFCVTAGATLIAFFGVRYLETHVDRIRKY